MVALYVIFNLQAPCSSHTVESFQFSVLFRTAFELFLGGEIHLIFFKEIKSFIMHSFVFSNWPICFL